MSDEIERITLDLTDCKYVMELHERIRVALDFPEFYGCNLSALWDLISEPRTTHLTIHGVHTMSKDCREEFLEMIPIFDRNVEWQRHWGLYFNYDILD